MQQLYSASSAPLKNNNNPSIKTTSVIRVGFHFSLGKFCFSNSIFKVPEFFIINHRTEHMKLWVSVHRKGWFWWLVWLKFNFHCLLLFRHDEEEIYHTTTTKITFSSQFYYFFLDIFLEYIKAHNNDVWKDIFVLHRQLQSSIVSQELIINQKKRRENFQTQQ